MFVSVQEAKVEAGVLEQKLAKEKSTFQRLALIDRLIEQYVYTNVHRAKELLKEQEELLKEHPLTNFKESYHLHRIIVENQLYDYNTAEKYALEAINYFKEEGALGQLAEAHINCAIVRTNLKKLGKAEDNIRKASKLLKNFPDKRLEAQITCRKGFLCLHEDRYSDAIGLFLHSIEIFDSLESEQTLKDAYCKTLIYSGLGRVYEYSEETAKSAKAYLQVVEMCERLGMTNRLAWHYLNTGRIYLALEDRAKAELYFKKVIDTRDDLSLLARANAYANLGICTYYDQDYKEALTLLDRAEKLHLEISKDDSFNLGIIANHRGKIYKEQQNLQEALEYFDQAYRFAEQREDSKMLADVCRSIAEVYADAGQFENAYQHQLQYNTLMEFHLTEVDIRQQKELEIKYEAAKKEQEAELLQLKATKLQLKALRAQMNPHFIYNALNSIQNYITSNDPSTASKYLAKFAKLMRQSLEYSDLEIVSLEKELEFLNNYLEINERLRFEDRMKYTVKVDDELEEDIFGVPTMIIQPYVENALEHGLRTKKDGHVLVNFTLIDDETILCVVQDNGIGRDKAKQLQQEDEGRINHRSRGTMITEKRLELLRSSRHQEVHVQTIDLRDEKTGDALGTRVEIKIPIIEIQL